jgi:hypothetical protein
MSVSGSVESLYHTRDVEPGVRQGPDDESLDARFAVVERKVGNA